MIKKIYLALGIFSLFLIFPFRAAAKEPVATDLTHQTTVIINGNNASVSFADLGYRDRTLVSPLGLANILFSTPLNWKLVSGGEIELHYDLFLSGPDINKVADTKNPFGGSLLLTFNGQVVGSIPLDETGSHIKRLKIPDSALITTREDGRNLLTISMDATFSCDNNVTATLIIKSTSFFDLFFEETIPELNLSHLPAPFYRDNSFVPESTLIVIPDNPDALEMQAALNVMSGFGSMIGGVYNMELVTNSQIADIDPTLYHMIFVGMPGQFRDLSKVGFQIPIANGKFINMPTESEQDGNVQLALSPWNSNKVIMLVSGNSPEAVLKAGQAVSSGRIFVYENPTLAFVSNVQTLSETLPIVEDFNFENLGYATETLSGLGVKSQEYLFYVSKDQVLTNEGSINLVYYHSGLLDYGVSSFSVELNGQAIASTIFSKESEQVTTLAIKIPPGTLRFGENHLNVSANMLTLPSCDITGFSDPWFIISNQSSIHLPVMSGVTLLAEPLLKDLKFFPKLFATHSDLGDLAFIFTKSDIASWKIAGKLAYNLGQQFNPLISNLQVAYADDVPQAIHDRNSMIILGLASEMPFLSEFNDMLPAPFDLSSNIASERQMQVIYRIPVGVSVGYLELMQSPFNAEKSILVVSGNDLNGVIFAGNGLLQDKLQSQLAGVFAVTNGTQVATGNASSPFSIVNDVVPDAVAINTTPVPDVTGGNNVPMHPAWLLPTIIISVSIILGVLGYVAVTAYIKRRSQPLKLINDITDESNTTDEK